MLSRQSPSGKTPPSASPAPPGSAHRPPRAGPRAPTTVHRAPRTGYRAPARRPGLGAARGRLCPATRLPPRPADRPRVRSPGLRSLTPSRPCSALAGLPGPQRSRGWKSGAGADSAGLAPRARPPPRTLGPVRRRRGRSSHPGPDWVASRARGGARTSGPWWARGPGGGEGERAEPKGPEAEPRTPAAGETRHPRLFSAGRLSGSEGEPWRWVPWRFAVPRLCESGGDLGKRSPLPSA